MEDGFELLQGGVVGGIVLRGEVHGGGEEGARAGWVAVGDYGVDVHGVESCDDGFGGFSLGG